MKRVAATTNEYKDGRGITWLLQITCDDQGQKGVGFGGGLNLRGLKNTKQEQRMKRGCGEKRRLHRANNIEI